MIGYLGLLAKILLGLGLALGLLILALRLAFPLPSLKGRQASTFIPASADTLLGQMIVPLAQAHPGQSGVLTLRRGADAFAARMLLANAAKTSIDAQYYIWQNDPSGVILLDALRRAALRGVRVRLLVDDNGTPGLDAELAALNALPNFEVRIFNPFTLRNPRSLSYLFDFSRLNRRMHNKSFTVDAVASIVGGRNIGDIYFAYGADNLYYDMDVLAVGQAAEDVSTNFDRFWNSLSAYPADLILKQADTGLTALADAVARAKADPARQEYRQTVETGEMFRALSEGNLSLEWVDVRVLSDDPAKGLEPVPDDRLLVSRMIKVLGAVENRIDLVSAYFVPGEILTQYFASQARAGVRIRTLTNSQEATDVLPVHAGYISYRHRLLDAGVEIYELKAMQDHKLTDQLGLRPRSQTSLHAKVFSVDDNRIFIGSFNFDPRSARLNCEMGFLI
ncbi:MAG TPA: phospholipase D family protein, partial [Aliiroseovarius sp.]|nr:phospholipase D family protein [Aliiroseovarius sp.]